MKPAHATLAALGLATVLGFLVHPVLGGAIAAGMVFYAWHRGL